MSHANVTAVIPVKALSEAKSRLAEVLGPAHRQELVLDMLKHVLRIARGSAVHRLLVVTRDPEVGLVVTAEGGDWVRDPGDSLNATLGAVFRDCWERGETPLYLPADLPRLTATDVQTLVEAGSVHDAVVLAPARDEEGTNALLVSAGPGMTPLLGPGSFARHLARAKRLGLATSVHRSAGLGLDIDTPEDLLLLASHAATREVHAP